MGLWKVIRLYFKWKPVLDIMEKGGKMSSKTQGWLQIVGTVISAGTVAAGILPPMYGAIIVAAIGLAKAVLAVRGHYFNPDGTPAAQPYDPLQVAGK